MQILNWGNCPLGVFGATTPVVRLLSIYLWELSCVYHVLYIINPIGNVQIYLHLCNTIASFLKDTNINIVVSHGTV